MKRKEIEEDVKKSSFSVVDEDEELSFLDNKKNFLDIEIKVSFKFEEDVLLAVDVDDELLLREIISESF